MNSTHLPTWFLHHSGSESRDAAAIRRPEL
jgi:hypothetical protein